jgi:hypothetical protein
MDCNLARVLLPHRRDADAFPAELYAALDRHLADCPGCTVVSQSHANFDAAVGSAMRDLPIPSGLASKLLAKTATVRRVRFYRKAGQIVGIAATVLIVAGLVGGVWWANRPAFNTDDVAARLDQVADNPERAVREWLDAEGLPTDLPLEFDFRHHVFHGKERRFGRDVPVIVFQTWRPGSDRPDTARLYLVPRASFNLRDLHDGQSSFFTAHAIRADREGGRVTFVVVYSGPNLDPFLKPAKPLT